LIFWILFYQEKSIEAPLQMPFYFSMEFESSGCAFGCIKKKVSHHAKPNFLKKLPNTFCIGQKVSNLPAAVPAPVGGKP